MKTLNILSLLIFILFHTSCSEKKSVITTLSALEGGKTIAVPTGTTADKLALQRFPDAKIEYYNSVYDCALAVASGKAHATTYDVPVLKNIAAKMPGVTVLDELLMPDQYGFAVAIDNIGLKNTMDIVLGEIKASGRYQEMTDRWFPREGSPKPMPEIEFIGENGILRFGTSALTEPMSFFDKEQKIVGFDIEFASCIALKTGRRLEIINLEFGAMLPALIAGKVDMIGAGLSITPERAKKVLFSNCYYESGIAAMVKKGETVSTVAGPEQSASKAPASPGKIGVLMGSIHDAFAKKKYPEANISAYNTVPDMMLAAQLGKVDGFFIDETSKKEIFKQSPRFVVLEEGLLTTDIAAGFNKEDTGLRNQFNQFLQELKTDGTYDAMVNRWMNQPEGEIPEIVVHNPKGVLKVGLDSDIGLPFILKMQDRWKGFDAELSTRFAAKIGRTINLTPLPFGSLLASLVSGKIDMISSSMSVTEERKKQIDFSDPYYRTSSCLVGFKIDQPAPTIEKLAVLDDISGKRVGVLTGSVFDNFVASRYPKAQICRFDNTSDILLSLKSDKLDAAIIDKITAKLVLKNNADLGLLSDDVLIKSLGIGFNKNNPTLLNEFNDLLKELRKNGTYDQMVKRWFEEDAENAQMPEFKKIQTGKKLVVGISAEDLPYVAMKNNQYVGMDIELIQHFAQRGNYQLEFVNYSFASLVTALASGKVDMIADGICITEERAKQISFSDEYAKFSSSALALKGKLSKFAGKSDKVAHTTFLNKLAGSFHDNIIREQRYLMIFKGLWITILISVLSAIAGTILGGLICFMRMSKNKLLNGISLFYISLIRGTPVLVLLMIIYYVIFAAVNINPVAVAILAFGFNFAAYVSEMFRTSIESIDKGQQEAGIASGFTKVQTFIFIIMPQALQRVLPVYKGEFVSLVKMTSVVGYIAVEDLTKASDIIRSRTFDAFFPLLMAAVIYILISWLMTLVLDYIEISVDPRRRKLSFRKSQV